MGTDGRTFLDAVWADAPFDSQERFMLTVERIAMEWEGSGVFSGYQVDRIVQAARAAEAELA
jgi:hypothetical protein